MKTSIEVILIKSPNCTSALGNEDTREIMEILKNTHEGHQIADN